MPWPVLIAHTWQHSAHGSCSYMCGVHGIEIRTALERIAQIYLPLLASLCVFDHMYTWHVHGCEVGEDLLRFPNPLYLWKTRSGWCGCIWCADNTSMESANYWVAPGQGGHTEVLFNEESSCIRGLCRRLFTGICLLPSVYFLQQAQPGGSLLN